MTTPQWKPRHSGGCTRPAPVVTTARNGRRLATCPDCRKFWWPDRPPNTPRVAVVFQPVEPPPAPARPWSRYRCRLHLDELVSWQGKGCQRCADRVRVALDRGAAS